MKVLKDPASGASELRIGPVYQFGPFLVDVGSRQCWRDDELVALTAKAFDTLVVLLRSRGRVVEKDELLKLVWPDSFVSDDSLTQNIATLRKTLGDSSTQPQYVATIPKHGYRFVAGVHEIPARTGLSPVREMREVDPAVVDVEEHVKARTAQRFWIAVSFLAILIVLGLASEFFPRVQPRSLPVRFVVHAPENTTLVSGGFLSPNGQHVAFVAQEPSGHTFLWVRALDAVDAHSLPGTDGAFEPFWSPNSEFVGFFAQGKLKRVGLSGAAPQTLAPLLETPAGGTWGSAGFILYGNRRSGLVSVPASGGVPTRITTVDPVGREIAHRWPHFLPDGRRFLYVVVSASANRGGVFIGSLDSTTRIQLWDSATSVATYSSPGYLFFVRDRALMAQRFDANKLHLWGSSESVAGEVSSPDMESGQTFSVGHNGMLAYQSGRTAGRQVWFGRSGERLGTIDSPTKVYNPAISPDSTQVAASSLEADTGGIWLFDLRRGVRSRFTTGGTLPLWSPDRSRIVFSSSRDAGILDLYQTPTDGTGQQELLLRTGRPLWPHDWSSDGRYIVYVSTGPATKTDLWLLPLFGERKPLPYLQTPFNEVQGQVSPDGRWMAYTSDESGVWEVYVQSFPLPGSKRTISTHGGAQPHWRGDGRELFYLAADHKLMAVDVRDGRALEVGLPKPLFQTHVAGDIGMRRNHYAVTRDGRRFLIDTEGERANKSITVVLNWQAALGAREK